MSVAICQKKRAVFVDVRLMLAGEQERARLGELAVFACLAVQERRVEDACSMSAGSVQK